MCVLNNDQIYDIVADTGIDTFCFIIEKKRALKLLAKLEIKEGLRLTSRNKTIDEYTKKKFAKEYPALSPELDKKCRNRYPFKIRYINFKRGGKSLTNTLIMLENSQSLNELCRKNKKAYGTYVEVVFAGLYQPSREILPKTHKVLKAFLDRFKTAYTDLAKDMTIDDDICNSKENFKKAVADINEGEIWTENKTTHYANDLKDKNIKKVFIYDKYIKETTYHKQRLSTQLKHWKRIEMRVIVKQRWSKYDKKEIWKYNEILDQIAGHYSQLAIFGIYDHMLKKQLAYFEDGRRTLKKGIKFKKLLLTA
ncbi:hypothetical protein CFT12S02225_07710 [Campylobacter fetus subsp. testudinum]|uniref:Transposase n=1 Tax=Campylobacter fetus subsp. testudinum TaxID=1507806 RepID=A0AAX0H9M2_CAMFE|nr:hypothetical protein [Campylobacter fetus]OCR90245.1 hypothetical protein CFT12S02225_07710 [Campylobacter fetus subsp. testudinum]OCR93835.1 hypothetical protein CFT12S02842_07775 [Campylobacter fetus subsp. testudinum]OCS02669.1 hypothetical protein CFTCF782_07720 [Campylobacter fetus subsp. testudinum]